MTETAYVCNGLPAAASDAGTGQADAGAGQGEGGAPSTDAGVEPDPLVVHVAVSFPQYFGADHYELTFRDQALSTGSTTASFQVSGGGASALTVVAVDASGRALARQSTVVDTLAYGGEPITIVLGDWVGL